MKKFISVIISLFLFGCAINAFAQNWEHRQELKNRDPFIPLIDKSGNLRTSFTKPLLEERIVLPAITLMGVSKIGDAFCALIDGEVFKKGDVYKELEISEVYPQGIIVTFRGKKFKIDLETEKK